VGGQAAEQIIAGVVLSERLAVTMYGAIHRAQFGDNRNLRGLVVDPKLLHESTFRIATRAPTLTRAVIALQHANIVPTVAVEEGGADVVVVTRGFGRYVTVQDLIASARANRKDGGKVAQPVVAAIAKSVVEALAAAHRANIVHGAVHPRSVLIDEDGTVRLGDFVVGRALTSAVAQGADAALWRGLAGFLAPELIVGEDPSPGSDVFAVGAMLFTMLTGEVPPGSLNVTPAVERLVQRALDTDIVRRYRDAGDLLENMLESFEDDRWVVAERGDVIKAAGLARSDTNIDEATEDLLASLGGAAVQVTPMRPAMDIRAEAVAARHTRSPSTGANKLEALLADLDTPSEHTAVDDEPFKRDPISEIIQMDPRRREAIVQAKPRVPSFEEDDEPNTPLPAPMRHTDADMRSQTPRPNDRDEALAMNAILDLEKPANRMHSAADAAEVAARKLEHAAERASEAAAEAIRKSSPIPVPRAPIVDPVFIDHDVRPPRLRSRAWGVLGLVIAVGGASGFYFIYKNQEEARASQQKEIEERKKKADEDQKRFTEAQIDPGSVEIRSNPGDAGVWLRVGPTPTDTLRLPATTTHELSLIKDGYQLAEVQVAAEHWTGSNATVRVALQPLVPDKKKGTPAKPAELPVQPTAEHKPMPGKAEGPIHVESTPADADVYLFVGISTNMHFDRLVAGRDYEFVVVKPGFVSRRVVIKADEWRDGGDPKLPIDMAKKKALITRSVDLEAVPKGK
jgi:serine/threonine protein kinase